MGVILEVCEVGLKCKMGLRYEVGLKCESLRCKVGLDVKWA